MEAVAGQGRARSEIARMDAQLRELGAVLSVSDGSADDSYAVGTSNVHDEANYQVLLSYRWRMSSADLADVPKEFQYVVEL